MGKQGSNLLKDEATGSTGENASIGEEESKRKDERQFYYSVFSIVLLIFVDIFIFRALKDGLQALCILILELMLLLIIAFKYELTSITKLFFSTKRIFSNQQTKTNSGQQVNKQKNKDNI